MMAKNRRIIQIMRYSEAYSSTGTLEPVFPLETTSIRWSRNLKIPDTFTITTPLKTYDAKNVQMGDWVYIPSEDGLDRVGHILKRSITGLGTPDAELVLSGKSFEHMFEDRLCMANVDTDWLPNGVGVTQTFTAGTSTVLYTTNNSSVIVPAKRPGKIQITDGSQTSVLTFTGISTTASTMQIFGLSVVSGGGNTFGAGSSVKFASDGYDTQTGNIADLIWYYITKNTGWNTTTGLPTGDWYAWVPMLALIKPIPPNGNEWDTVTYSARYQTIREVINALLGMLSSGYQYPRTVYTPFWSSNKFRVSNFRMQFVEPVTGKVQFATADTGNNMAISIDYEEDRSARKTWVKALGAGSGGSRPSVVHYSIPDTGFNSAQTILNASDTPDYQALEDRAREGYDNNTTIRSALIRANPYGMYQYPSDYDVGDIVSVWMGELGTIVNLQITTITETVGPGEHSINVTAGNPPPPAPSILRGEINQSAIGALRQ